MAMGANLLAMCTLWLSSDVTHSVTSLEDTNHYHNDIKVHANWFMYVLMYLCGLKGTRNITIALCPANVYTVW